MSRITGRGSFWPNTAQRALLQLALGPAEHAAVRWQSLQPLDVTTLEPGSFSLLPLLHEGLSEAAPGDPQLGRLAGTYRSIWYRNRLLLDRLATLLPHLRREGIDGLLVGGASALLRWYPRLGLRPVGELELAVEPGSLERAVAAAGRAGWQPGRTQRPFVRMRDADERVLVVHAGVPPSVAGPAGRAGAYRILRARAVELEAVEGSPLVLDAGDELLLVCAVGARTAVPPSCQWLVDAYQIIRSGQLPPADELVGRARRFHLVEPLRTTVLYLAELLGRTGLEEHLAALETEPTSRRDRAAFLLAGRGGKRAAGPAQTLAAHLQATADEPLLGVATHFPRSLEERWGARGLLEVSALALRKTARLLRPEAQAGASRRNRSASS